MNFMWNIILSCDDKLVFLDKGERQAHLFVMRVQEDWRVTDREGRETHIRRLAMETFCFLPRCYICEEAADLPNSERGTEQSPEPVLEGSLQPQAGGSVRPDMEREGSGTATGLQPGAVQRSSLSEPQQAEAEAEAEAAVTAVAVQGGGGEESGAVEVERAAEELAAVEGGADSEDGAEEMEGELSDSSLNSDIPDSQPFNRGEKIYTLDEFKQFMESTKGKTGVEIENFFPDLRLFLHTAHIVTRKATLEEFDQQKRYRLKKYVQIIKKKIANVTKQ
ncbi:UNVERIFIED_CONTAM: hypothetical protein FKN15_033096 [Acipenser sinensis]